MANTQTEIEEKASRRIDPSSRDFLREVGLLQRLFERTESLYKPMKDEVEKLGGKENGRNVRLALMSRNTAIDGDGTRPDAPLKPRVELPFTVTRSAGGAALATDRAAYRADLDWLKGQKSDIAVFNELGYPWLRAKGQWRAQDSFDCDVQQFCDSTDSVLISGSFHDAECRNVCWIYRPHGKKIEHVKMHSAVNALERLPPAEDSKLHLYEFGSHLCSVLICVDVFVPSVMMRLARINQMDDSNNLGERKIGFVLVPSFSEKAKASQKVANACWDLSVLANCVVAMVNCTAGKPHMVLYCAGHESSLAQNDILVWDTLDGGRGVVIDLSAEFIKSMRDKAASRSSGLLDLIRGGDLRPVNTLRAGAT